MDLMTGNVAASLFGAFDAFSTVLGATAKRPPDRGLSTELRSAADMVLQATDRDDLLEAIDELLVKDDLFGGPPSNEPEWTDRKTVAARLERWSSQPLEVESLRNVLGRTATAKCEEGQEALVVLLRFGSAMLKADFKAMGIEAPKFQRTRRSEKTSRSGVFYDLETPAPIRRATISLLRSFVTALVIARAEERGERLQPWLAMCLAESFAEGFVKLATFVQSLGRNPRIFDALAEMKSNQAATESLLGEWWSEAKDKALHQSGDWNEAG